MVLQNVYAKEVAAIEKIEYIVYDTIAFAHLTLEGLDKIVYVIHRDRKIKKLKWVSITEHFSSVDEMKTTSLARCRPKKTDRRVESSKPLPNTRTRAPPPSDPALGSRESTCASA